MFKSFVEVGRKVHLIKKERIQDLPSSVFGGGIRLGNKWSKSRTMRIRELQIYTWPHKSLYRLVCTA